MKCFHCEKGIVVTNNLLWNKTSFLIRNFNKKDIFWWALPPKSATRETYLLDWTIVVRFLAEAWYSSSSSYPDLIWAPCNHAYRGVPAVFSSSRPIVQDGLCFAASTVFGRWPCWESPAWGPLNDGRKRLICHSFRSVSTVCRCSSVEAWYCLVTLLC
jgi:hypothetical protein